MAYSLSASSAGGAGPSRRGDREPSASSLIREAPPRFTLGRSYNGSGGKPTTESRRSTSGGKSYPRPGGGSGGGKTLPFKPRSSLLGASLGSSTSSTTLASRLADVDNFDAAEFCTDLSQRIRWSLLRPASTGIPSRRPPSIQLDASSAAGHGDDGADDEESLPDDLAAMLAYKSKGQPSALDAGDDSLNASTSSSRFRKSNAEWVQEAQEAFERSQREREAAKRARLSEAAVQTTLSLPAAATSESSAPTSLPDPAAAIQQRVKLSNDAIRELLLRGGLERQGESDGEAEHDEDDMDAALELAGMPGTGVAPSSVFGSADVKGPDGMIDFEKVLARRAAVMQGSALGQDEEEDKEELGGERRVLIEEMGSAGESDQGHAMAIAPAASEDEDSSDDDDDEDQEDESEVEERHQGAHAAAAESDEGQGEEDKLEAEDEDHDMLEHDSPLLHGHANVSVQEDTVGGEGSEQEEDEDEDEDEDGDNEEDEDEGEYDEDEGDYDEDEDELMDEEEEPARYGHNLYDNGSRPQSNSEEPIVIDDSDEEDEDQVGTPARSQRPQMLPMARPNESDEDEDEDEDEEDEEDDDDEDGEQVGADAAQSIYPNWANQDEGSWREGQIESSSFGQRVAEDSTLAFSAPAALWTNGQSSEELFAAQAAQENERRRHEEEEARQREEDAAHQQRQAQADFQQMLDPQLLRELASAAAQAPMAASEPVNFTQQVQQIVNDGQRDAEQVEAQRDGSQATTEAMQSMPDFSEYMHASQPTMPLAGEQTGSQEVSAPPPEISEQALHDILTAQPMPATAEEMPSKEEPEASPVMQESEVSPVMQEAEELPSKPKAEEPHAVQESEELPPEQESEELPPKLESRESSAPQESRESPPRQEFEEVPPKREPEELPPAQESEELLVQQESEELPAQESQQLSPKQESEQLPAQQESEQLPSQRESEAPLPQQGSEELPAPQESQPGDPASPQRPEVAAEALLAMQDALREDSPTPPPPIAASDTMASIDTAAPSSRPVTPPMSAAPAATTPSAPALAALPQVSDGVRTPGGTFAPVEAPIAGGAALLHLKKRLQGQSASDSLRAGTASSSVVSNGASSAPRSPVSTAPAVTTTDEHGSAALVDDARELVEFKDEVEKLPHVTGVDEVKPPSEASLAGSAATPAASPESSEPAQSTAQGEPSESGPAEPQDARELIEFKEEHEVKVPEAPAPLSQASVEAVAAQDVAEGADQDPQGVSDALPEDEEEDDEDEGVVDDVHQIQARSDEAEPVNAAAAQLDESEGAEAGATGAFSDDQPVLETEAKADSADPIVTPIAVPAFTPSLPSDSKPQTPRRERHFHRHGAGREEPRSSQMGEDDDDDAYNGPATRSRCVYHLVSVPYDLDGTPQECVFAMPLCSIQHDILASEGARHLGPATRKDNEAKEWFEPEELPDALFHKIHRIVGNPGDVGILPETKGLMKLRTWSDEGDLDPEQLAKPHVEHAPDPLASPELDDGTVAGELPTAQEVQGEDLAIREDAIGEMKDDDVDAHPRAASAEVDDGDADGGRMDVDQDTEASPPSASPRRSTRRSTREPSTPAAPTPRRPRRRLSSASAPSTPAPAASLTPATSTGRKKRAPRHPSPHNYQADFVPGDSDEEEELKAGAAKRRRTISKETILEEAGDEQKGDVTIEDLEVLEGVVVPSEGQDESASPDVPKRASKPRRSYGRRADRSFKADPEAPGEASEEDQAEEEAKEAKRAEKEAKRREVKKEERRANREEEIEAKMQIIPPPPPPSSRTRKRGRKSDAAGFDPKAAAEEEGAEEEEMEEIVQAEESKRRRRSGRATRESSSSIVGPSPSKRQRTPGSEAGTAAAAVDETEEQGEGEEDVHPQSQSEGQGTSRRRSGRRSSKK